MKIVEFEKAGFQNMICKITAYIVTLDEFKRRIIQ